jgi:hypothetical protein
MPADDILYLPCKELELNFNFYPSDDEVISPCLGILLMYMDQKPDYELSHLDDRKEMAKYNPKTH